MALSFGSCFIPGRAKFKVFDVFSLKEEEKFDDTKLERAVSLPEDDEMSEEFDPWALPAFKSEGPKWSGKLTI